MSDDYDKATSTPQSHRIAIRWFQRQHLIESATVGVAVAPAKATLATLLASHILRDGEIVLMILKPSLWFIVLSSLRFAAVVLIVMIAAKVYDQAMPGSVRSYFEAGSFLIAGRLVWATLQWMGRLYVLTDLRIVRLSGVLTVDVFDCPLRKIARTRIVRTSSERVVGAGSIEIIPQDDEKPIDTWQTVARPKEVHEVIVATITRAKQGPFTCG